MLHHFEKIKTCHPCSYCTNLMMVTFKRHLTASQTNVKITSRPEAETWNYLHRYLHTFIPTHQITTKSSSSFTNKNNSSKTTTNITAFLVGLHSSQSLVSGGHAYRWQCPLFDQNSSQFCNRVANIIF